MTELNERLEGLERKMYNIIKAYRSGSGDELEYAIEDNMDDTIKAQLQEEERLDDIHRQADAGFLKLYTEAYVENGPEDSKLAEEFMGVSAEADVSIFNMTTSDYIRILGGPVIEKVTLQDITQSKNGDMFEIGTLGTPTLGRVHYPTGPPTKTDAEYIARGNQMRNEVIQRIQTFLIANKIRCDEDVWQNEQSVTNAQEFIGDLFALVEHTLPAAHDE